MKKAISLFLLLTSYAIAGPNFATQYLTVNSFTGVAVWGDSVAQGQNGSGDSMPSFLEYYLGAPCYNFGIGGCHSAQVAERAGAESVTCTVLGGSIIAGAPNTITFASAGVEPTVQVASVSIPCVLAGIYGNIVNQGGVTDIFTTDVSNGVTTTASGAQTLTVNTFQMANQLNIVWVGLNDVSSNMSNVVTDVANMVSKFTLNAQKYVILGVWPRNVSTSWSGTVTYGYITGFNTTMENTYPNNYIDLRPALEALANSTAQDQTDVTNGVLPTSLTTPDNLHPNSIGYAYIAQIVANFIINTKGWLGTLPPPFMSASCVHGTNLFMGRQAGATVNYSLPGFNGNVGTSGTGVRNLGVGPGALSAFTTGNDNVGVGDTAGSLITTGGSTTSVGSLALANDQTGGDDTAIGYLTLNKNTGSHNTAIGSNAFAKRTSNNDDTAVGYKAAQNATSSAQNTIIGSQSAAAITTATNCVVAGYNANVTGDVNNQIVIGASAVGDGINTTHIGNSSVTQVSLNGKLVLPYATPITTIPVSGVTLITSGGLIQSINSTPTQ
jgi:lysophospholipase L1-like esterase